MTIKAGQAFEFDVKIIGEPPPSVSWHLKDRAVSERATLSIKNVPYNSKLTCDKAERKDSGTYKITATNAHGEDTAEVEVTVVCKKIYFRQFFAIAKLLIYLFFIISAKPSKPEGPLEVSDVNKNGCKLKWNKPKDDGGEPIDGYIVEKKDPDTGAWVPIGKTRGPDMEVTGLTPGKAYEFRVKAVNKEGESEPLETLGATVAKDPFCKLHNILLIFVKLRLDFSYFYRDVFLTIDIELTLATPTAPGKPEPTDWNRDHVDLKWTPPSSDGGSPITHYVIEKKEKGSSVWEKATEVPGSECKGTAPFLTEGKEYEFRVVACNKAGPGEPSQASVPVVAKPRFRKCICLLLRLLIWFY